MLVSDQPPIIDVEQEPQSAQNRPVYMQGPKQHKPVLTYVLMVFTVLIYFFQTLTKNQYGLDLLFVYFGKINNLILGGQLWRLITPVFLHGSMLHLLMNMYALYILGRSIETINGSYRFGMLYFIGAFGGNVLSFVLSKNPSLGASTAIFGLLAAEAIFIWQNRDFFPNKGRNNLMNIGSILALNLVIGLTSGSIDNWGHIGGLIAGAFFAFLAGTRWSLDREKGFVDQRTWKDAVSAFVLIFIAFSAIAAIPFFTGG